MKTLFSLINEYSPRTITIIDKSNEKLIVNNFGVFELNSLIKYSKININNYYYNQINNDLIVKIL